MIKRPKYKKVRICLWSQTNTHTGFIIFIGDVTQLNELGGSEFNLLKLRLKAQIQKTTKQHAWTSITKSQTQQYIAVSWLQWCSYSKQGICKQRLLLTLICFKTVCSDTFAHIKKKPVWQRSHDLNLSKCQKRKAKILIFYFLHSFWSHFLNGAYCTPAPIFELTSTDLLIALHLRSNET